MITFLVNEKSITLLAEQPKPHSTLTIQTMVGHIHVREIYYELYLLELGEALGRHSPMVIRFQQKFPKVFVDIRATSSTRDGQLNPSHTKLITCCQPNTSFYSLYRSMNLKYILVPWQVNSKYQ